MADFDIALRIRTQSSYELSLGSSRSSMFCSGESVCLQDDDLSNILNFRQLCAGNSQITYQQTTLSSINNNQFNQQNNYINSQAQYVIQQQSVPYKYNCRKNNNNFDLTLSNLNLPYYRASHPIFSRSSQPIQISVQESADLENVKYKRKPISNSAPSSQYPLNNFDQQNIKNRHYTIPLSIQKLLTSYRRSPNITRQNDILNFSYGSVFGFVIGDAIGSHLIHKSQGVQQSITKALEMRGGGIFNLSPGQGTDETEIMLALGEGLIDCNNKFQLPSNSQRDISNQYDRNIIAKKYYEWYQISKPFDYPTLIAISFSQIRKQKLKNNGNLPSNIQKQLGSKLIKSSQKNYNHESNIGLIRMIPLTLWSLELDDQQYFKLVQKQMSFFTPNSFVKQVCFLYGKLLRIILISSDHQFAIHEIAKWVYNNGSQNLKSLWSMCQSSKQLQITSKNMNLIHTSFLFSISCINKPKKKINFIDSLIKILLKGYNTDTNCAIVMGLVGAVIGYGQIPNYFKNLIIQCKVQKSEFRPRGKQYCPSRIVDMVPKLLGKYLETK